MDYDEKDVNRMLKYVELSAIRL